MRAIGCRRNRRPHFGLYVRLDLRLVSGFRRAVVERLPEIPYGTTRTYAAMARVAGNPNAVRAVGSACSGLVTAERKIDQSLRL